MSGYAEMYEWEDGNPNKEDRFGLSVILRGDKIIPITNWAQFVEQDNIIGVVATDHTLVTLIGNMAADEWHGKYKRGHIGQLYWEPHTMVEWIVSGFRHWYSTDQIPPGLIVPKDAVYYEVDRDGNQLTRKILTNEFDDNAPPYKPRWARNEWGIVILLGRAIVRDDTVVGRSWIKLRDLEGTTGGGQAIAEWFIR